VFEVGDGGEAGQSQRELRRNPLALSLMICDRLTADSHVDPAMRRVRITARLGLSTLYSGGTARH
jgi:hypothetical protein